MNPLNPGLSKKDKEWLERLEAIDKSLRTMKRHEDMIDVHSLALFPEARLPPKFKMPDMDRFDGTSCPKTHLKMYVGAMKPLGIDEDLLAQLFQRTLKGAALKWFVALDESAPGRIFAMLLTSIIATTWRWISPEGIWKQPDSFPRL